MGRLQRELTDPWGLLVAGVVGGIAWAATVPVAAAVGVGAAVYGVKVAYGALTGGPDDDDPRPSRLPRPAAGTPGAYWLGRAEQAVRQLDRMAATGSGSPTDLATAHAAEEADGILEAMCRIGAQVVAVDQALAHVVGGDLEGELARLRERVRRSPDDTSAARSAEAVADRIAVRDRLQAAASALAGRMESSALGLESLVARVAEVRATAAAVGQLDPSADDLAALTTEVEGLRVGLADAERVARSALGSRSA